MILGNNEVIDITKYVDLAIEVGFSNTGVLNMTSLVFRQEVRDMCADGKCKQYGHSWSCPPACGSLENMTTRVKKYSRGIIVQTTGEMNNEFDLDAIHDIEVKHKKNFDTLVRQVRRISQACLPMGAGSCTKCRRCTYPSRPCRHPETLYPSMEACGLLVSEVCTASGIKYNYGNSTMTFTSCILID